MSKKPKRKRTAAERAARKRRKAEFQTVFIDGKQKRVRRPQMINGLPVQEFIRRNADPVWLMQNGYYEHLDAFFLDPSPDNSAETKRADANPAESAFEEDVWF